MSVEEYRQKIEQIIKEAESDGIQISTYNCTCNGIYVESGVAIYTDKSGEEKSYLYLPLHSINDI